MLEILVLAAIMFSLSAFDGLVIKKIWPEKRLQVLARIGAIPTSSLRRRK